jgi:protein CpxP
MLYNEDLVMMTKQVGMMGVRTALLALCTLTVSAIPAMAQDNTPPPAAGQDGPGGPGGGHRDPARMEAHQLEMMTKHLNLTPDQVTQVKAIDDAQRTQMMALRDDQSTARADKRAKMMAIHQDSQAKIRAVLTDDQKPKYDAMLAKEKERMEHRREGGDGAPPPPPPTE